MTRFVQSFPGPGSARRTPSPRKKRSRSRASTTRSTSTPTRWRRAASAFGGLVCGGFQTAALAWALVLRSRMFDQCPIAGIGVDELRWLAPVRPGDTLRCRFTLLDARRSAKAPDRGVARFRYEMLDQDDRAVMTLVMIQLPRYRPTPGA